MFDRTVARIQPGLVGGSAANRRTLGNATLWWVSADLVDLIQVSSETLPDVELRPELLPATPTLAVFERPLHGCDAFSDEHPVLVDALTWDESLTPSADGSDLVPGISVVMYRRIDFGKGLSRAELAHVNAVGALHRAVLRAEQQGAPRGAQATLVTGEDWVPLGRTDWRYGDDWSTPPRPCFDTHRAASLAEDRRWLTVLWSLASHPGVVDSRLDEASRPERRRAARSGYSTPDVRVVRLRAGVAKSTGLEREPTGKRTYRVRWMVKPHWRQQPYGPGRSLRRPVLIGPYIKGPEGAPLHRTETVHVLDGRPPEQPGPPNPPAPAAGQASDLLGRLDALRASDPPDLAL